LGKRNWYPGYLVSFCNKKLVATMLILLVENENIFVPSYFDGRISNLQLRMATSLNLPIFRIGFVMLSKVKLKTTWSKVAVVDPLFGDKISMYSLIEKLDVLILSEEDIMETLSQVI
jgi:hypothetical protein